MCGIVGYIGPKQATEVLIGGLQRLEYRGYDSAGLAILQDDKLCLRKILGKLRVMEQSVADEPIIGTMGIGHTRWATHGRPSVANAHPHVDASGRIALVHNGIIENFLELKQQLEEEGVEFKSETDTEVIVQLVGRYYEGNLEAAVRKACADLEGAYAIAVWCIEEPDRLIAARLFSPLIVGLGDGENFIASDIPAILKYTRKVYILDDGDMAVLTTDGIALSRVTGEPVEHEVFEVDWDDAAAEKSGYKHFMLKEINEQPAAFANAMRGRIREGSAEIELPELTLTDEQLLGFKRGFVTACGTAYYAGLVGKFLLENVAKLPVGSDLASEYRYRNPIIDEDQLTIVVSQSGETADTLAALRMARDHGSHTLSIVNAVGSSIARDSDDVLYINAGPEIGVASTKAYSCQSLVLAMFALHMAKIRKTITEERYAELVGELHELPAKAQRILDDVSNIQEACERYGKYDNFLYLGRGANLPSAYEGALKLKEISYIHAEGYAAGEMKHGPIALIEPACPTVAPALKGAVYDKVVSNIQEVKARDGDVIAVAFEDDEDIERHVDFVLRVPRCDELLSPILVALPLQLFAYYIADARGCDVDQPRNLAKSVTVE